ncbi:MAG: LytTR family transcriptional regulator DNA-binding domain-containing protein [Spirosoma sp.]|nr:LytTR family transcriptional regulator DNA-binding domain-containing protein [Spirosoma sp.]
MKEIRLTRSFLRNPLSSVMILLGLVLLMEALSWSIGYSIKSAKMDQAGGALPYIGLLISRLFIPELVTLFIVVFLLNSFHELAKIRYIPNTFKGIATYELSLCPVLLIAFVFFNPFTQTVRFLTEHFPIYSFQDYWQDYIIKTYTWSIYFTYLFPVLLIGYLAINISLIIDSSKQRRSTHEATQAQITEAEQKIAALSATFIPRPIPVTPTPYLTHLKGKGLTGEMTFTVNEAYFYTVEDRIYYAELTKGRFQISKTINELEKELDPDVFFRIKRDYIINRQAVQSFSYWENGKYIVRLNTPDVYEIVVPRNRMNEFKDWLQLTLPTQNA